MQASEADVPSRLAGRLSRRRCRLLLACLSVLFTLLALEVVSSVYSHFYYRRLTRTDPVLGWKYRPTHVPVQRIHERNGEVIVNTISINREGFRDDEFTTDPSVFKVMALGDSMTFGLEADQDEIYPAVLEHKLEQEVRHRSVDVMNFGITGFGTAQEALCLEQFEPKYEPDVVTLMMFEPNDFEDNATVFDNRFVPHFELTEGGKLILHNQPSRTHKVLNLLRDHSTAYFLLAVRVGFIRESLKKTRDLSRREVLELTLGILEHIADYTEERDISFYLFLARHLTDPRDRVDAITAFAERRGIPFRSIAMVPDEEVAGHGHWNGKGHAATAEKILTVLTKDPRFTSRLEARPN